VRDNGVMEDRQRIASAPGRADEAASDPADCALVIFSCDKYRDLWGPSLSLHRRYWPDCPYPTFLVSDTVPLEDPRVRSIVVGAGLSWSEMARSALLSLPHREVLFMVEDFFLTRTVSSAAIEARRRSLHALGGVYLRLVPLPRPSFRVPGHPGIGEHERGSPFRASLQAAFWDRRTLLDLLRPAESVWDFEREASVRSAAIAAPFYATWWFTLRYVNAVVGGRWSPAGRQVCRREGLTTDGARLDVTRRWRLTAPLRLGRLAARGPVAHRVRKALGLRPHPG
jgi:hypothetical protein